MSTAGKSLWQYVLAYRAPALLGFVCVLGTIGFSLGSPFLLRQAIDGLRDGSLPVRQLLILCALFFGAAALATLFAVGMRRILLSLAYRVEYDIRRDVFAQLTRLDAGFYQRERTGDIMTRMTSDLGAVRELVGQGLLQGSRIVIGLPLAFGIMFFLNLRMALIVLGVLPIISVLFSVLMKLIRWGYDACQDQYSTLANFAQETFAGVRTIKGFAIEERRRTLFAGLNREYIRRTMALARLDEPVWPFMAFAFSLGVLLLLLVGGRQVMDNSLSLGKFVQFNQYLTYLQWPMLALGWTINLIQRGRVSWQRIRTLLEAESAIGDPARPAPPPAGGAAVAFERVTLTRDGRTLLDDISLTIPPGQCLGLTGPTGSGKTLLVSLLPRLLDPTAGAVRLSGRDVREYRLADLRRALGMAPQEPFLFSDTLANNIALGLGEHREDKVLWAAEIAHLRAEAELFPLKFETPLGERGVTLSGGQRQRAAISRAIARRPSLLILDDVFSAVDTQTEAKILSQLRPALQGCTSILISHRVSTLRHADRVLVLENGRLVQDGRHEDLVRQPGYYQALDEIQRLEAKLEEPETSPPPPEH